MFVSIAIKAYLCSTKKETAALVRSGYSSIKNRNRDQFCLPMAGHTLKRDNETVDYKGSKPSNPIHKEFHHITSAVLYKRVCHGKLFSFIQITGHLATGSYFDLLLYSYQRQLEIRDIFCAITAAHVRGSYGAKKHNTREFTSEHPFVRGLRCRKNEEENSSMVRISPMSYGPAPADRHHRPNGYTKYW